MNKRTHASFGAMDYFFLFFIVGGILFAAANGKMEAVNAKSFSAAKDAVNLAIGLIGIMAFWLGMMRILEAGGLVRTLSRLIAPLFSKLFSDIPAGHPALGAIILNISANMLGLGNAATPFGIKAMEALQKLNKARKSASNAMCLFLTINTSGVALLPLGVIGVRAAAGASNPASIWVPSFLATCVSTLVGTICCLLIQKSQQDQSLEEDEAEEIEGTNDTKWDHLRFEVKPNFKAMSILVLIVAVIIFLKELFAGGAPLDFIKNTFSSFWLMPYLIVSIIMFGIYRGVRVYEAAIEGAKEGFDIALRIIPFMVVILVAIGIFRESGALALLADRLSPITSAIGLPAEVLPMIIIRPLSGSGAFAVMSEIIQRDPDSYEAFLASILMGSTETTFYVLTVYFGAVGVMRYRHAILCGLAADISGMLAGCFLARLWF